MALPLILVVAVIYLIIAGIMHYMLEPGKVDSSHYGGPPPYTPQFEAARAHADLVAERAYRKALFLIILGVIFCFIPFPFLFLLGGLLLVLGVVKLIWTMLFDDELFTSRI
jgi:hypothetical protein